MEAAPLALKHLLPAGPRVGHTPVINRRCTPLFGERNTLLLGVWKRPERRAKLSGSVTQSAPRICLRTQQARLTFKVIFLAHGL